MSYMHVSLRVVEDFIFCSKAENVRVIASSFLDKRSTLKSPMTICGMPGVKSEAACQHNSSETTEQNFMKLGR
jgi:hypothetical protein